jgi:hypothetical protein
MTSLHVSQPIGRQVVTEPGGGNKFRKKNDDGTKNIETPDKSVDRYYAPESGGSLVKIIGKRY